MADGFVLNVDAIFLQDLEKADKKMSDLVDKSNSLSKSVVEAFNKISSQGVDPFLEKLRQQKTALEAIANVDIGKNPSKGIRDLVKAASQSVDQINKLIIALQGAGTAMDVNRATKKVDSEIKKETDSYLKELEKQIKARQEYLSRQERVEQERVKITQDATKQVESEIKKETDAYLKNLEIKIKAAQEQQLRNERVVSERKRIESEVVKHVENEIKKEKDAHLKSLSEQIKARQEYLERVRKLQEAQARKESEMRAKEFRRIQQYGDTSGQATSAYSRLYGEHGIKSINNMNRALQRLQDAQNKLNLNTDKGRQKYDELGKKIQQIKRDLDKATQANEKFNNSHSKLLNTTDQLQRKLALLFSISAIQGYMDKLVNVRKEFELQQKSLQVLLRDKDQADKLWQQTVDLAVKSPFRVSQLVSYTKQLAAYRIESDKLYDTTKMLSDVSAGLGVDMQRIILAFGQVRAANFLRGTELRQFTEAGIPMLDELAQMFTELEGRVVRAGDVFERISKRMVTFRDVEEVFKRMTSSSGVFYNMQEEQSKTLFGMISNLHDSIDLMLNDIGRSNDGIIKDMVSLTRDLVENWRGVATVLKQVGVTLAMIGLAKFVTGWRIASTAIATGSTSAALAMNGMAGSAARLRIAMSTLGKTISAHPWFLLVGAIASAGHALWEYIEAFDAANAKYDDMSRREIAHIDQLEELQKKTEQYNATIEDGNSSEQARNKAQLENDKILSQIKAKYPELYPLIVKQTDGTIDLTKAIEEQNVKLIENIALQQQAKGGFFQETLDENYKESIEAFGKLENSLSNFKVVAMDAQSKLGQALHDGLISQGDYDRFSELLSAIRKSKDFKQLHKAFNDLTSAIVRNGKEVAKQVPLLGMFANEWVKVVNSADSYKDALDDLRDNFKNQKNILKVGIQDAFDEAGGGESGAKAAGEYISSFLDKFNIVDKNIREWAEKEIPKLVQVEFEVIYPTKSTSVEELEPWAKRVKDAVEKINNKIKASNKDVKDTDLFPIPEPGQMREQYLNVANAVLDVAKATYREGQKIVDDNIVKQTKMLKPFASEVEAILNIDDKNKGNGKGKDWMSEVVKGIKEAHQEYIKLNKTLEDSEAKQLALNKYAKSFAESAKNAGLKDISLGQFKFETEEGAIEALTFLKNKLPQSAKQARFKLEEAIGEIRGEVRIRTKAEDDKLLIDQIEDMFSGYEMSIELQKLNIPPDLAKQLFNIDTLTLPELKSKVVSMESQFVGTDMEEEYRKFLKKIDEMEEKAQMGRLEKYSKYLIKAQSERVKIKMEEMRQLDEIEKLGYTDTQKQQITQAIKVETQQKLDKEAWESFKNTDFYIQMFEDLGVVSGNVLNDLQKRLVKMRGSLSNLSPQELKEVVAQLERVTSEQISRNPFENLGDTIGNGVKALKRLKDEQNAYNDALKEQESTQSTIDSLQISIEETKNKQKEAKATLESSIATKEQKEQAMAVLATSALEIVNNEKLLDVEIKRLAAQKGITEEAAKKLILTRAEVSELNKTANSVGVWGSTITDSVSQVTSMLKNWGIDFGEEFEGVLSGLGQAFGALENIDLTKPMSVISGVTGVVSGLGNAFASIFGFGNKDNKKEKQIQREIKFVEDLQRAYQKLEKAIDNAYSINTLQVSGQATKKNIDAQIASYNKMIAAEKDKKKTDKDRIKEWQLAVEDLIEQKAELDKELVSVATSGIMDDVLSASQEFTNAWLEAFNETGDGLSGLETNFKETMLEMVKQQAAMLISQSYVEKWKKQLEQYINPDDLELSTDEAKKWVDAVSNSLPQLNDALERYFTAMQQAGVDVSGGTSGELSGLQRGIQSVSESTAQIIEAYLNSVRFYVADSNTKLTQLVNQVVGGENTPNPILSELKTQTELVRGISTLLNSVVRGSHSMGGQGIKVFIS